MKVSVFNKDTGDFLYYGEDTSRKVVELTRLGNVVVPNIDANPEEGDPTKIEVGTGRLLVDVDKKQGKFLKRNKNKEAFTRRIAIRNRLKEMKGNPSNEALNLLIEYITLD